MHIQGANRGGPLAHEGEYVHEIGAPHHEYKVVEATPHRVVLEHVDTGEVSEWGAEFTDVFEH